MKKLFSLLIVAFISVSVFAQSAEGTFYVVPKAGLNLSNFNGSDLSDELKWKCGFIGGVEGGYQVSEKFALTGGLLYSMQGVKDDVSTFKMNYLNVPILANYYVGKGFALKAGIEPGFKLSAKVDSRDMNNVKNVVFAIPIGASYEYQSFILDARYNIGITKIEDGSKAYNSVFQFTLGYKFEL